MTDMIKVEIEIPADFAIGNKVAGEFLPVDPTKMSNSWKLEIFRYGFRKVNDNCKGDLPSERLALARELVKEMNSGAEFAGRSRGGSATMSPTEKRAVSMAKEKLKAMFKAATGVAKIADMCSASDKVAAYFTKDHTWNDEKVKEWIATQAGKGTDYMALAEAALKAEKELADSLEADAF